MAHRYTIECRHKGNLHYPIGVAETIEHAKLICYDLKVVCIKEYPLELKIYDHKEKKWIDPPEIIIRKGDWDPAAMGI